MGKTTKATTNPAAGVGAPTATKTLATKKSTAAKQSRPPAAGRSRPTKAVAVRYEDVALRAYFLSEKRRHAGLPGDDTQDWLDAEQQLKVELAAAKKSAAARPAAAAKKKTAR